MRKTVFLIVGIIALTAIGIGGGLGLVALLSEPEESSTSSHESTSANHSGPTNLSEARVQDLTKLKDVNVSVVGGDFRPNNIQIRKGTKVTWTNNGTEDHAIMKENGDNDSHSTVSSKDVKENVLSGPTLAKDKTYEFTFNSIEQIYYHCPLHPNVRGKITVIE